MRKQRVKTQTLRKVNNFPKAETKARMTHRSKERLESSTHNFPEGILDLSDTNHLAVWAVT